MNKVFLLLGANLGSPAQQLAKALIEIESQIGKVEACSSLYESEAWGVTDQPVFLNQVALISTDLSPLDVLDNIQAIENNLGRVRLSKWGARVIDIDILYFNHDRIQHDRLIVPHPYLPDRRFVLVPLAEIAPSFTHPELGITTVDLLTQCEDDLEVRLHKPNDNDAIQID